MIHLNLANSTNASLNQSAKPTLLKSRRSIGIKASLVGGVLLTITLTALIVYIPWAIASKRNLKTIVAQTNEEIVLGASQEVKRLFGSASTANHLIQNSFYQDLIDYQDPQAREAFFLSVLESNPDFSWIQIGFKNGDFLGVQRLEGSQFRTHFRQWDVATHSTLTTIKNYVGLSRDETVAEVQEVMRQPFDATVRPWYTAAVAKPDEQSWSVYVFRTTHQPGVGAAVSLSKNDEIFGVAGVSIGLDQLSHFLRKELWSQSGEEVFIINDKHEILASTDLQATVKRNSNVYSINLPPLSQTENPLLQHVNTAISELGQTEVLKRGSFEYIDKASNQSYYISLSSLEQLDWMVGTIVPAEVYLGEVQRARQILLAAISLFIVTTAGVAVVVSDRLVARPILTVASAAADIEEETFKAESLSALADRKDEFGQLARVFQEMARQIAEKQQKLKRQVSALKIEIDDVKRKKQVEAIVETDFFQDLTTKASNLRRRSRDRRK